MLRLGCVKYLNARPLIRGWPGDVQFDHPSALCERLANGDLDVALVSSFEFLRNPIYRIVDEVSIASDGPVYSVVIAHRGEFSDIEEIELDPASRTAVNLTRCLLAELGLQPRLIEGTADSVQSHTARARLLIGDHAIKFRQAYPDEFQFWDLGEQWKKLTGIPFVYALWLIRPEVAEAKSSARVLRELRDANLVNIDRVIANAVAEGARADNKSISREFLADYYRKNLRFSFGPREKQGLQAFFRLCVKHRLLPDRDFVLRVV